MKSSSEAVRALAAVRWRRLTLYVLPWRSVWHGLLSCLIVIAILLAVDRLVLGSLERGGWTAGELWARHNKLVEDNHRRKTTTDQCQLREWTGEPLAEHSAARKILVLGDSFVWGPPYTTLNHLWWRQLAIELERRGYRDVQVVAAGHPGWSTHQQLECARRLIPEVKPDIVLWGYVTNDPDEKLVRQIFDSQDRFPLGQRARVGLKRMFPNLMFKFESLRNQKLAQQYAGPEYGYAYVNWEQELLQGDNLARYRETVAEVGELISAAQTPAFLLTLPSWPCREYFEPRYAPVLPLWEAAGVPVHNTLPAFIARYGNAPQQGPEAIRWGINPADSHPGPEVTHFHAVMAADYLAAHWPDLLGPKDKSPEHKLAINDWLPSNLHVRQTGDNAFELDYPLSTEWMPQLPLGEPTALVALRYPLAVDQVDLFGAELSGGQVWISLLHAGDAYDECDWHDLGSFSGRAKSFRLPADLAGRGLTTIRFTARFSGDDRRLRLTIHPGAHKGEQ